jgi:hypothetical protein
MKTRYSVFAVIFLLVAMSISTVANPVPEVAEIDLAHHYHELFMVGENLGRLPEWIAGVEQAGGNFMEQPGRWTIPATLEAGQGKLVIALDREKLDADLALTLIYEDHEDTDMAVQLLDDQGRVIAGDLFSNAIEAARETQTDTFIIPLCRYPTASKIALRRIAGPVVLYSVVLMPVMTDMEQDGDLVAQLEMAKLLKTTFSPESPTWQAIQAVAEKKRGGAQVMAASRMTPERNEAITVGVDLVHGILWADELEQLKNAGVHVVSLEDDITKERLNDIDVLLITGVSHTSNKADFSDDEVQAIDWFVRGGGGLLCAGQAWSWVYPEYGDKPIEDYPLNTLGRQFGFRITGFNIDAPVHGSGAVIERASPIKRENWWPSKVELQNPDASALLRDETYRIMAGQLPYGEGTVVVMGHDLMLQENPALTEGLLQMLAR